MKKVDQAHRGDSQRGVIALPRGMDGAACVDADEDGDQSKGNAAGGGDGDEAAMVSGCDDGRRWGRSRGHSIGEGSGKQQKTASFSSTLGLAEFIVISGSQISPVLIPRPTVQGHVEYEMDVR